MKHCILVKWNKEVDDKKQLVNEVKTVFDKLLKIEGIQRVVYHENCTEKANRFDLMICIYMEKEILPVYDASSPHLEWKEKYGKYVENKAIFDLTNLKKYNIL